MAPSAASRACRLVLCPLAVVMCGCVKESTEGDEQVFTYALWSSALIMLAGVLALIAAWLLRKHWRRRLWSVLPVVAFISLVIAGPSGLRDEVRVGPDTVSVRTGLWGLTAVHRVRFANVRAVRMVSEEKRGAMALTGRHHFLLFQQRKGRDVRIPISNDLCRASAPRIVEALKAKRIPVLDEAGRPLQLE